jgi:signal recognition particle GTPase
MFDSLSNKLQDAFKNLRGLGKISEANVGDSLREVRMALLEADVNFKVARDFIDRVKQKSRFSAAFNPDSRSSKSSTMRWWTCSARRTPAWD